MKFLALFFFLFSLLDALPVGNPAEATLYQCGVFWNPCSVSPCSPFFVWSDAINLRFGYYGDFVRNRRMIETLFGDRVAATSKTAMQTNAFLAITNICHWMDVFGTFGASSILLSGKGDETQTFREVQFSPAFSWSVGTHVTLYHKGHFYVGGEGQYFRSEPDLNSFFNYASGVATFFNNTNPMIYEEWQVGFGCSCQLMNSDYTSFVPYGAIKFSQGKFTLRGFQFTHDGVAHQLPDLVPEEYFGYAIGITWLVQSAMGITLEKRWLDEDALFIYGEFKF